MQVFWLDLGLFFVSNMEQWDIEVVLWMTLIPEDIHKCHACGGKMSKTHFPTFLISTIPASGTRTCLQDPNLQLEAGGRNRSWAGTIQSWKLPAYAYSWPFLFLSTTNQVTTKSISTSCRLETHQNEFGKGWFVNDFSLYEHQQPGLFTNDFIYK